MNSFDLSDLDNEEYRRSCERCDQLSRENIRRGCDLLRFLLEPENIRSVQVTLASLLEQRKAYQIEKIKAGYAWALENLQFPGSQAIIVAYSKNLVDPPSYFLHEGQPLYSFMSSFQITPETSLAEVRRFVFEVRWFFDTDCLPKEHSFFEEERRLSREWNGRLTKLDEIINNNANIWGSNPTIGEALSRGNAYVDFGMRDSEGEEMTPPDEMGQASATSLVDSDWKDRQEVVDMVFPIDPDCDDWQMTVPGILEKQAEIRRRLFPDLSPFPVVPLTDSDGMPKEEV